MRRIVEVLMHISRPPISSLVRRVMESVALGLALLMPAISAPASDRCNAILPDAAVDVGSEGLPSQQTRWSIIQQLWEQIGEKLQNNIEQSSAAGLSGDTVDLIQGRTNDALREAISQRRDALASSLLKLWLVPLARLSQRDRFLAYYLTPAQRVGEASLEHAQYMWVDNDGLEAVLHSAIYLAGATDIALAVAQRATPDRSEQFTSFARRISELALSHYTRWAFGPPHIWQVRGFGCDASGLDLVEFTQRRADRSLGNGRFSYCVAPTDLDMLLVIGISNLLRISKIAPELMALSSYDSDRLSSLLRLQTEYMASRLVWRPTIDPDGQSVSTVDFDPGAWASHEEWSYASDESPRFPVTRPNANISVGRDISHGYRIAWMAMTLAEHSEVAQLAADWNAVADALARQFGYFVVDLSTNVPKFRNYLDGSNGWYRVNYNGKMGFGYPPYGLSRTFLEMPWARLANRDSRLMTATLKMWEVLSIPSHAACTDFDRIYVEGNFWKDWRPFIRPFSDWMGQLSMLPFIAVSPVR